MIPLGIFPLVSVPVQSGGVPPFMIPSPQLPFEYIAGLLNARNLPLPISEFHVTQPTVPFTLGENGIVEVINYSPFVLNVNVIGGNVSVNQEPYSKCAYRAQNAAMGQLSLTLSALQCLLNFNSSAALGLTPIAIVNTYQDGEIDLYAPVALSIPPFQTCPQYASFQGNTGPTTITVDASAGGSYTPPVSDHWILGFDLTFESSSAATSGTMTIQNLAESLSNAAGGSVASSLQYRLRTAPNTANLFSASLIVRFPGAIGNAPGFPIQFLMPALSNYTFDLNVYYLR